MIPSQREKSPPLKRLSPSAEAAMVQWWCSDPQQGQEMLPASPVSWAARPHAALPLPLLESFPQNAFFLKYAFLVVSSGDPSVTWTLLALVVEQQRCGCAGSVASGHRQQVKALGGTHLPFVCLPYFLCPEAFDLFKLEPVSREVEIGARLQADV